MHLLATELLIRAWQRPAPAHVRESRAVVLLVSGVISTAADKDVFGFDVGSGLLSVSLNVAPPTRTRSVLKNRALAAAYRNPGGR